MHLLLLLRHCCSVYLVSWLVDCYFCLRSNFTVLFVFCIWFTCCCCCCDCCVCLVGWLTVISFAFLLLSLLLMSCFVLAFGSTTHQHPASTHHPLRPHVTTCHHMSPPTALPVTTQHHVAQPSTHTPSTHQSHHISPPNTHSAPTSPRTPTQHHPSPT